MHQENGHARMHENVERVDGRVKINLVLSTKDCVNAGNRKGHSKITQPGAEPFGVLQRFNRGRGRQVLKILNYLQ